MRERSALLRLLKSSGESQLVPVGTPENRKAMQNMLLVVCDKLTDGGVTGIVQKAHDTQYWVVIVIGVLGLAWAVWQSKRESKHDLD